MKSPCFFVALILVVVAALAPPTRAADVYSVLDGLGPTVVNHQVSPHARLRVEWDGIVPNLHLNGQAIEILSLSYDRDRIATVGMLPNLEGTFQVAFSLNSSGNLVVETSSMDGLNGVRLLVAADSGVVNAEVCVCHGSDANSTVRACTNSECDDAGTQCNTSPPAATHYCAWREQRRTPTISRPVGGAISVVK